MRCNWAADTLQFTIRVLSWTSDRNWPLQKLSVSYNNQTHRAKEDCTMMGMFTKILCQQQQKRANSQVSKKTSWKNISQKFCPVGDYRRSVLFKSSNAGWEPQAQSANQETRQIFGDIKITKKKTHHWLFTPWSKIYILNFLKQLIIFFFSRLLRWSSFGAGYGAGNPSCSRLNVHRMNTKQSPPMVSTKKSQHL